MRFSGRDIRVEQSVTKTESARVADATKCLQQQFCAYACQTNIHNQRLAAQTCTLQKNLFLK